MSNTNIRRFSIGDRVRFLEKNLFTLFNWSFDELPIGHIKNIRPCKAFRNKYEYLIVFDIAGQKSESLWVLSDKIEKIENYDNEKNSSSKFKVGDYVQILLPKKTDKFPFIHYWDKIFKTNGCIGKIIRNCDFPFNSLYEVEIPVYDRKFQFIYHEDFLRKEEGIQQKKYIAMPKPFDKVLVRNENDFWQCGIFSNFIDRKAGTEYCWQVSLNYFQYCIPYEGNENLIGTKNEPRVEFQE